MDYKLFWDTNCLLDIFENRTQHLTYIERINEFLDLRCSYISALTIANMHYISKPPDMDAFKDLVFRYKIVDLTKAILGSAFDLKMKDFEDAIQLVSAMSVDADFLLTWNKKDYKKPKSRVKVVTPKEYLELL